MTLDRKPSPAETPAPTPASEPAADTSATGIPGARPAKSGDTTTSSKKNSRGITCAKCNHVNKSNSGRCDSCGSHLHIKCNDCGARNERVYSRCQTCGRRLHKTIFEKMNKRIFTHGSKIAPGQIAMIVIAALVIFLVIYGASEIELWKL